MNKKSEFKKIAVLAANTGNSKKAEDIAIYELGEESMMADYVVIMTAESHPQIKAIEDAVSHSLKQKDLYILYRDGLESKNWKILDYGGVIVHIFESETREFYSLDKIYHEAKKVKWEKAPAKKIIAKKPAVKKKIIKKPAAKKAIIKKPAIKKKPAKKPIAKKTIVKKSAVKKKIVKKSVAKKTISKKAVKKTVAKKAVAKKKPIKKIAKKKK